MKRLNDPATHAVLVSPTSGIVYLTLAEYLEWDKARMERFVRQGGSIYLKVAFPPKEQVACA